MLTYYSKIGSLLSSSGSSCHSLAVCRSLCILVSLLAAATVLLGDLFAACTLLMLALFELDTCTCWLSAHVQVKYLLEIL